jgi:hypothetical protein
VLCQLSYSTLDTPGPLGRIEVLGGPDGVRTRDLRLDRPA